MMLFWDSILLFREICVIYLRKVDSCSGKRLTVNGYSSDAISHLSVSFKQLPGECGGQQRRMNMFNQSRALGSPRRLFRLVSIFFVSLLILGLTAIQPPNQAHAQVYVQFVSPSDDPMSINDRLSSQDNLFVWYRADMGTAPLAGNGGGEICMVDATAQGTNPPCLPRFEGDSNYIKNNRLRCGESATHFDG